jgi:hypothetical protein
LALTAKFRDFENLPDSDLFAIPLSAVSSTGTNIMLFDQSRTIVLETKLVEIADFSDVLR